MSRTGGKPSYFVPLRAIAALAMAFALSGCMSSMGDFDRRAPGVQVTTTASTSPALNLEATSAQPTPAATKPAASAQVATVAPAALNQPPEQSSNKLLTPEEKAKVIAELEALAARQGAPTAKARQMAEQECADAASSTLDPEERLKRERQGLKC